jgi:DNA-directed RNA polymerase specialized sigma24 family protein
MEDELTLVRRILAGDIAAWHRFVEIHNDQMQNIIGRYVSDHEIRRDLLVSLLEKLKDQKLAHFDGRSTLSTWLFVVIVNHCRDYFRSAKGIRHVLTALEGLRPIERRFFKLAFVQGMPIHEVLGSIRAEMGEHITYLDLIQCEERIVAKAREKKLGRLIEKLLSPAIRQEQLGGAALAAIDQALLARRAQLPPDILVDSDLLHEALQNLREALLNLPHRDQIILKLKFEHKASAKRICEVLDLGNERMVYRRLEKLLAKLKAMLLETGMPLEIYEGIVQNFAEMHSWEDGWNAPADGDGSPFH